jgi:O-antigen/teichoic acid export membrane protein
VSRPPDDSLALPIDVAESDRAIARDLRSNVLHGLKWSATFVLTITVARIATSLVIVHLLAPQDVGLAGMALLFSSLVLAFSDLGLGAGLVQRESITEEDRSTVFWTSFAVGLVLTVCGIALAGPLSNFFHEPRVRPLFMVVSLSFVLIALQTTQAALFQRAMRYRAISIRVIGSTIAGAVVGIVVAVLGGGAWALVAQAVSVSLFSTILIWALSNWRPSFTYSVPSLRDMGGFGVPLLGGRMLDYVQGNADNILIGRYLGASSLGLYGVAYNVILLPTQRLLNPVQEALFPAFSRIQHDKPRMATLWMRISRVVGAVIAPSMLGLVVVAPDFVPVVLGDRWNGCVPVVQILAFVTLMQGFTAVSQRTLTALGLATLVFRNSALRSILAVAAFVAGLHWGIVGVAAFYTVMMIPAQLYLVFAVTRELDVDRRTFARSLAGVAQASLAMSVCCLVARELLVDAGVSPAFRLLAVILVGIIVYLPAIAWRCPQVISEIANLRRRSRRHPVRPMSEGA